MAECFHHRLVQIHIFPNDNGRHARLLTEIILKQYQAAPTWELEPFAFFILILNLKIQSGFVDLLEIGLACDL
ncbi:MAG: Fic family protein [Bdellovibrionaceae bacterium]|nr:Fic family protein [Pseudobdellovibrionaceae bacterium]